MGCGRNFRFIFLRDRTSSATSNASSSVHIKHRRTLQVLEQVGGVLRPFGCVYKLWQRNTRVAYSELKTVHKMLAVLPVFLI